MEVTQVPEVLKPTATEALYTPTAQTAPPPPPTAPAPSGVGGPPPQETPPPQLVPSKPKGKRIILGFILLLLIGLTAAFVAVAYQGIELPYVPKELSLQMQKTYAKLPFVPKAPRHILLQSMGSTLEAKTLTLDASMSITGFDLAFYGDAEFKEGTSNLDFHLSVKISEPTLPLTLEADLISIDKILYFKIDTLSSPLISAIPDLGAALEKVEGKWWQYDLTPLETQARKELEKEAAKTPTQQAQWKAIDFLFQPEVIKAITREKDEKIGEEMSYHLRIAATKEVFLKLVEIGEEEPLTDKEKADLEKSFEGIEKLEIDFWIGKNTFVMRKAKLLFKVKSDVSPYTTLLGLEETLAGVFVLEIPKINAPVSISAPEGAQDVEELIKLLFGSAPELPSVLGEQTKLFLKRR